MSTRPRRALVVDDSPVSRLLLRRLLEDLGLAVTEATNGREGLERAVQGHDLIVADLSMPEIDGLDMIAALRANPAHMRTPIVVTTATWSDAAAHRCEDLDVSAWVLKPIDGKLLKRAVVKLLARFDLAEE